MEAFYDEDNFYFYEMGYRLNATMEYKFVEHFEHYNPLEFMIQYAVEGIFGNKSVTDTRASIFQGAACELSPLLKKEQSAKSKVLRKLSRMHPFFMCTSCILNKIELIPQGRWIKILRVSM